MLDRALDDLDVLVRRVSPQHLADPTPCTGWNLADLLRHLVGQARGFEAAISTGDAPPSAYEGPEQLSPDHAEWTDALAGLRSAAATADPASTARLAELDLTVPVELAVGMQTLDAAVHSWDVATALGETYRPDADIARYVHGFATQIAARPDPSAVFAAPLPTDGTDEWHDALRLLGRDV